MESLSQIVQRPTALAANSTSPVIQSFAPWQWQSGIYVGADYLFTRAAFENPAAFVVTSGGLPPTTGTIVNQEFAYQSTPRVFIGWRWANAGAVQFTYTRFDDNANVAANAGAGEFIFPPNNENQSINGQPSSADSALGLRLDIYDIDFLRPIRFAGGLWDFTPTIGARVADFRQQGRTSYYDSSSALLAEGSYDSRFVGGGPHAGIEMRRYFGAGRTISLFGRADASILVGAFETPVHVVTTAFSQDTIGNNNHAATMVPLGLEVGGSWQPTARLQLSAGWQFQHWFQSGPTGDFPFSPQPGDLSLDGFFARVAWVF